MTTLERLESASSLDESMAIIKEMEDKAIKLCEDLLNPDVFGFSVTAEVRNRARAVFGFKETE